MKTLLQGTLIILALQGGNLCASAPLEIESLELALKANKESLYRIITFAHDNKDTKNPAKTTMSAGLTLDMPSFFILKGALFRISRLQPFRDYHIKIHALIRDILPIIPKALKSSKAARKEWAGDILKLLKDPIGEVKVPMIEADPDLKSRGSFYWAMTLIRDHQDKVSTKSDSNRIARSIGSENSMEPMNNNLRVVDGALAQVSKTSGVKLYYNALYKIVTMTIPIAEGMKESEFPYRKQWSKRFFDILKTSAAGPLPKPKRLPLSSPLAVPTGGGGGGSGTLGVGDPEAKAWDAATRPKTPKASPPSSVRSRASDRGSDAAGKDSTPRGRSIGGRIKDSAKAFVRALSPRPRTPPKLPEESPLVRPSRRLSTTPDKTGDGEKVTAEMRRTIERLTREKNAAEEARKKAQAAAKDLAAKSQMVGNLQARLVAEKRKREKAEHQVKELQEESAAYKTQMEREKDLRERTEKEMAKSRGDVPKGATPPKPPKSSSFSLFGRKKK